jgi:hypothetical protein
MNQSWSFVISEVKQAFGNGLVISSLEDKA